MYRLQINLLVLLLSFVIAQNDSTPPSLTYFSFAPNTIDVTTGPDTLTFTIGATDDLSGLTFGTVGFVSPSGRFGAYGSLNFDQTSLSDTSKGTVIIDQFVEAGEWNVDRISIYDIRNGNNIYSSELQSMGFPTKLSVSSVIDTTHPELTSFSINTSLVDVTSAPSTATFTIGATDKLSGLANGDIWLVSPSNSHVAIGIVEFDQGSLDDTAIGTAIIEQFVESGEWTVSQVSINDVNSNWIEYYSMDLQSMGFPTKLTVNSVSDVMSPELTYFSFSPDTLDVTTKPDTLNFLLGATDDVSGLAHVFFTFLSPLWYHSIVGSESFEQGSLADTISGFIVIDQNMEAGEWEIDTFSLYDIIGNYVDISPSTLQSMGFPTKLTVISNYLSTTDENTMIDNFKLHQNYPNPFNPITNIQFNIPESSDITLKIFNSLGELVATPIIKEQFESGSYKINLNLGHLPNGVYLYTLEGKNWVDTKKMILLK